MFELLAALFLAISQHNIEVVKTRALFEIMEKQHAPIAADPQQQEKLNTLFEVYLQTIRQAIGNLDHQYDLNSRTLKILSQYEAATTEKLQELLECGMEYERQQAHWQAEWKNFDNEVQNQQNNMISLCSEESALQLLAPAQPAA